MKLSHGVDADAESWSSGMRYSGELVRAPIGRRVEGRFTSADALFLNLVNIRRTRELLCPSSSSSVHVTEKRVEELNESASGDSSAAETRSPNSTREKGGAREDEGNLSGPWMVGVGREEKINPTEPEGSYIIISDTCHVNGKTALGSEWVRFGL